jgi:hypothetical protein
MKKAIFMAFLGVGLVYGQNPATPISYPTTAIGYTGNAFNGDFFGAYAYGGSGDTWDIYRDRPIPFIYRGTPFTDTEYRPGTATIHGNVDITAPMRYNAQQNVIEFLDQDQIQRELLRRPYITANFGGKNYMIIAYLEQGIEKLGYVIRLNTGAVALYFMPKKILKRDLGYRDENPIYKYQDISEYFLKIGKAPAEKIKLNKKSVLEMLPDHTEALEAYVAENNLDLHTEYGVIQVLDHYNAIEEAAGQKKDPQS